MSLLKEKLKEKILIERARTEKLLKEHSNVKVDEVNIGQIIGGMRDIKSLVTDISYLDPQEGIRFRGLTIPEVLTKLPSIDNSEYPSLEGFLYFLLTGEIPTSEIIVEIRASFDERKAVPQYVFDVIHSLPKDSHPMVMFSSAILAMQRESVFAKEYLKGIKKNDYWEAYYEDAMNLLAKLPEIVAHIYRWKYYDTDIIPSDPKLGIGANFSHMMGLPQPYDDVTRLYVIIHADHESGNVSAHTGHLVASALSDIYYSISAMLGGLAGPLHGLANEEVLRWLQGVYKQMGGISPTEDDMKKFVYETLDSGKVIPGFGHAVLRKTDPRYFAQREFCLKHMPDDPLFKYVDMLYRVVPNILLEKGKAKNPWPNVDAQSGVIQWHYGVQEYDFYTVLFGMSRAIGVCSNIIWARALGYPLERPKSLTTQMLEDAALGIG
jgi:citrate synthase